MYEPKRDPGEDPARYLVRLAIHNAGIVLLGALRPATKTTRRVTKEAPFGRWCITGVVGGKRVQITPWIPLREYAPTPPLGSALGAIARRMQEEDDTALDQLA